MVAPVYFSGFGIDGSDDGLIPVATAPLPLPLPLAPPMPVLFPGVLPHTLPLQFFVTWGLPPLHFYQSAQFNPQHPISHPPTHTPLYTTVTRYSLLFLFHFVNTYKHTHKRHTQYYFHRYPKIDCVIPRLDICDLRHLARTPRKIRLRPITNFTGSFN